MKKTLVLTMALVMAMGLTACGGGDKPTSAPAPTAAVSSAPAKSTTTASAEPEYSAEQQELAQEYLDMCAKYDEAVDKVNGNPALLENTELVDTMNELAQAIIEADEHFANPETLTDEVMEQLRTAFEQTHAFIDEVNKLADTAAAGDTAESITVSVEVVNDTGVDIHGLALSPANDDNWGENLLTEPLAADESGVTEMTFTADTLVWDLLAEDAEGNQLSFMGIDFSEANADGAKLVLSATEGGDYVAMFTE